MTYADNNFIFYFSYMRIVWLTENQLSSFVFHIWIIEYNHQFYLLYKKREKEIRISYRWRRWWQWNINQKEMMMIFYLRYIDFENHNMRWYQLFDCNHTKCISLLKRWTIHQFITKKEFKKWNVSYLL